MDNDEFDDDGAILDTIIDGTRRGKTHRPLLDIVGHIKTSTKNYLLL